MLFGCSTEEISARLKDEGRREKEGSRWEPLMFPCLQLGLREAVVPNQEDLKCSRQEQHHGVSGKMMFETKRLEYTFERRRARQALQGTLEPYGVED